MEKETKEVITDFLEHKVAQCSVLVFGDVMLDRYFSGDVLRISPEAPVPVRHRCRSRMCCLRRRRWVVRPMWRIIWPDWGLG